MKPINVLIYTLISASLMYMELYRYVWVFALYVKHEQQLGVWAPQLFAQLVVFIAIGGIATQWVNRVTKNMLVGYLLLTGRVVAKEPSADAE